MAAVEGLVIERWHRPHMSGVILVVENPGNKKRRDFAIPWIMGSATYKRRFRFTVMMDHAPADAREAIQTSLAQITKTLRWEYHRLSTTRRDQLFPGP